MRTAVISRSTALAGLLGLGSFWLGCSSENAGTPRSPPGGGGSSGSTGLSGSSGSSLGGGGTAALGGSGGAGGASSAMGGSAATAGSAGVVVQGGTSAGGNGGGAGSPAAGHPCSPRPGVLFCEDFEQQGSTAPSGGSWSTSINGDGTVVIDSTGPAHSGSKSVHVHGSGFQTLLVYHDPAVLPQSSGRFYARSFIRLGESMTTGHNTFVIADTFAAPGAGNSTRIGEMNAMLMMTVGGDSHGYLSNQNYYSDHLPGTVFALQIYTCLETLFDATGSEIQVWVDGKAVPDLHVNGLAHENYDTLRFGFEKYAGPVSDLWFDDIAFGTQPIGCD